MTDTVDFTPTPSHDLTAREAALFTLFAQAQIDNPWVEQVQYGCGEGEQAFGALCTNLARKGLLTIRTSPDPHDRGSKLFYLTEAGFDLAEAQGIRVDRSSTDPQEAAR